MMSVLHVRDIGETLAPDISTRIQLCGAFVARVNGVRVDRMLPGRQGRTLFGYLVAHRHKPVHRAKLMDVLWPDGLPAAADSALNALLAKIRAVVGNDGLIGKREVRLVLPSEAWVDLEAARQGLHRAESATSLKDWTAAWAASRVALHIAVREFMSGCEGDWITAIRRSLEEVLLRAHECVAISGLALGGPEIASADRSARALMKIAPYRESGYRLAMQVLASQGNIAEALLIYENLRQLLRRELGVSPSSETQALHKQLLERPGTRAATQRDGTRFNRRNRFKTR